LAGKHIHALPVHTPNRGGNDEPDDSEHRIHSNHHLDAQSAERPPVAI